MSTISLRLNDDDAELIKNYAKVHNISISDFVRQAIIEKIEDEMDLHLFQQAMIEHQNNPQTFTFDEVVKELGLNNETI